MFEVRAVVGKNRLVFKLAGELTLKELAEAGDQLLHEVRRLRPGLDFVTDIREVDSVPDFPADAGRQFSDLLVEMKVRRVVRVVGKKAKVALAFERCSRAYGLSANLAYSIEEAERLLDSYTG